MPNINLIHQRVLIIFNPKTLTWMLNFQVCDLDVRVMVGVWWNKILDLYNTYTPSLKLNPSRSFGISFLKLWCKTLKEMLMNGQKEKSTNITKNDTPLCIMGVYTAEHERKARNQKSLFISYPGPWLSACRNLASWLVLWECTRWSHS